ncbi:MAG: TraR/DksA family transcriptional regulator [Treponema sp.]|nr:TraR/DksA family transcriptional regulator [Treponema sp.]
MYESTSLVNILQRDNYNTNREIGKIMDQKFIDGVKKKLVEQRTVLLESLASQNDDMKSLVKSGEAGDIVDIASDAVDRALLDTLSAQDSARLEAIDNALDRIREGTYGICVKCGTEIPQARLKALPYAVMCVSCTEEEERRNR